MYTFLLGRIYATHRSPRLLFLHRRNLKVSHVHLRPWRHWPAGISHAAPKTISSGFLTRMFLQGVCTLCKLFKNRRESIKYRRHTKRMMQIFVVCIVTHAHLYIKQYPFTVGSNAERAREIFYCGCVGAWRLPSHCQCVHILTWRKGNG